MCMIKRRRGRKRKVQRKRDWVCARVREHKFEENSFEESSSSSSSFKNEEKNREGSILKWLFEFVEYPFIE